MIELKIEGPKYKLLKVQEHKLDSSNSMSFKSSVLNSINEFNETVIIDLSGVEFVDSSGLGALISILKSRGGSDSLILCGLTRPVEKLFQLTKMNTAFNVKRDADEAVNNVAKG